ncbi:MAG: recombination mediator RecR [Bryobacteraceae bacterium]|jgi:recombination protein RecR|nr:recombination protein RecR [Solibacteraceae bacterium]MCL4842965.1 recombination mediator RecR [Bryobacteraceae bacterium]MCO5351568.1 recombination mediator RecR [Bryobacteraceae bacterium]HRJ22162.1 recombination mediator RecR [Bryobacteraceae bacterium]
MPDFAEPLARLIQEVKRLPGIGQKSAQRIAFHVLRASREDVERLSAALLDVKNNLGLCAKCNNIADAELCLYCRDPHRDPAKICVVEDPLNLIPIETTRTFSGLYHVLHGSISPLRGIGPEQLRIKELLTRIQEGAVEEIILATNPTVEGEATAVYLARLLKPLGLKVTRIAMGIPVGSDLEYADEVTMSKSLENRREM